MLLVAGVYAPGAVTGKEVAVELQARDPLEDRRAHLFGAPGVDGGLVDHHRTLAQYLADALTRPHQGRQIRPLVIIDRGWHRDDKDLAATQPREVGRNVQAVRSLELRAPHFERGIAPLAQLGDARGVHVEAGGVEVFAELHGEWQAHVSQAHHTNAAFAQAEHHRHLLAQALVLCGSAARGGAEASVSRGSIAAHRTRPPLAFAITASI